MYGTNLQLVTKQCCVCHKWIALWVDPDDLERHSAGLFAQLAFARRDGLTYLDASLRELFITGVCPDCWDLLCPDPITHPTSYN
jgi:hypothetical protein